MKKIHWLLQGILLLILLLTGCNSTNDEFNVLSYGARGDGKTLDTEAFNKAIQACNKAGGGRVLVPPGTYVSGTITLLSHVNLHLLPGSVILGSKDTADYRPLEKSQFHEGYNHYGLVNASDAVNISITGEGEINGNGSFFMNGIDKPHMGGNDFDRKFIRQGEKFMKVGDVFEDGPVSYAFRPGMLVVMLRCENIVIQDVTFKDSPEWTFRIGDCDNVLVEGITIRNNPLIPNSDGIHTTTSRNVRISNCDIVAGDDAIIVTGFNDQLSGSSDIPYAERKTGNKTGRAENVIVSDCLLSSRSACIRVGYGENPIRNLIFSHIIMYESNRGIGIFARDKSSIENVQFSNIQMNLRLHSGHWWGKGEPVHISVHPDTESGVPGKIRNIRFTNLDIQSETGMVLLGMEGNLLENISFHNVSLHIRNGKNTLAYGGNIDLRPAYPLNKAIFKADLPGILANYVESLSFSDVTVGWGENQPEFFTGALEVSNFKDLSVDGFKASAAHPDKNTPVISIADGTGWNSSRLFLSGKGKTIHMKNLHE